MKSQEKKENAELRKKLRALEKDPNLVALERRLKREVNVFDILKVSETEIRHSNVLAWLLDANGNHGIGDFLIHRLFTEITGRPGNRINFGNFRIYRERGDIDLLLTYENPRGKDKVVICIENKVNAKESKGQLRKYQTEVETEFHDHEQYFCFLTVAGDEPSSSDWMPLSYEFILDALQDALKIYEFTLNNRAEMIIRQYLSIIERKVKGMDESTQKLVNDLVSDHRDVLEFLASKVGQDDRAERAYSDIMTWLDENLPENYVVDEDRTIKNYIRIHSRVMSGLFPNGKDGVWGNGSKYYYEIHNNPDGRGSVKLVFSLTNLSRGEKEMAVEMCSRGNAKSHKNSQKIRTAWNFTSGKVDFLSDEDDTFVGADALKKVFYNEIPAYEASLISQQ